MGCDNPSLTWAVGVLFHFCTLLYLSPCWSRYKQLFSLILILIKIKEILHRKKSEGCFRPFEKKFTVVKAQVFFDS